MSREYEPLHSKMMMMIIKIIIIIPNILLQLADLGASSDFYRQFAKSQIDYILGDSGRSYVVGFGYNPPTHAHHRARYSVWRHPSGWVLSGQVSSKHEKHSAILLYHIGIEKGACYVSWKECGKHIAELFRNLKVENRIFK